MVFNNKRGGIVTGLSTLSEIIIILIATGLFLGVFSLATSKVDEKTSENLCRGFNALRLGPQINLNVGGVNVARANVAPNACKTIDKKDDIPSGEYKKINDEQEAASSEIRDLMTRCWWMWLEGKKQNVFNSGVTLHGDKKCFICYTFSVDKSVQPIDYRDFLKTLNDPYYAIDSMDRCAPQGNGGKCMPLCNPNSDEFSKEVSSDKCNEGEKCCVAVDAQDECKNKGGLCKSEKPSEDYFIYSKWQCKSGTCYVKKENIASYLDYLQGTGGVDTGAGAVLFADDEGFHKETKYAITFLSPGPEWNLETLAGLGTTGAGAAITTLALVSGVGTIPTLIGLGATGAATYLTSRTGDVKDLNYVMVSTYDRVKDVCDVQTGVGES